MAILAVALHHFGVHPPSWIDWGPVGPSVFFLLSGYLITLSLWKLRDARASGTPEMGLLNFHARRIFRLLPVIVILMLAGAWCGLPEYGRTWLWNLTFTTNFLLVAQNDWAGSVSHFWSLAVQEQFYLLWPAVLLLPKRWFGWAMGGLIAGAAAFRLGCILGGAPEFARWFLLPASLDAFATGGLVAWWMRNGRGLTMMNGRWAWPFFFAAVASLAISRYLRFLPDTHPGTAAVEIFECGFFLWLLMRLLSTSEGWLSRLLAARPLVFIGKISYGIFAFHVLVAILISRGLKELGLDAALPEGVRVALFFGGSIAVAAASWHWLEQPLNRWVRTAAIDVSGVLRGGGGRLARGWKARGRIARLLRAEGLLTCWPAKGNPLASLLMKVFLLRPGKPPWSGPYSPERVRAMVRSAEARPTDLYWMSGMGGWEPLGKWLAVGEDPAAPAGPRPRASLPGVSARNRKGKRLFFAGAVAMALIVVGIFMERSHHSHLKLAVDSAATISVISDENADPPPESMQEMNVLEREGSPLDDFGDVPGASVLEISEAGTV